MVIGLWPLHHLDGVRALASHWLHLHDVGSVGSHGGDRGYDVWHRLVIGGRDQRRYVIILLWNKAIITELAWMIIMNTSLCLDWEN